MNCLCAGTRRAARMLTQIYEEELRQAGLTAAQFELLGTLRERTGLPQSELTKALGLNQTTLSRNLKLPIQQEWVERKVAVGDRRHASYRLTSAGEEVFFRAYPHWKRAQERMKQVLGADWQIVSAAVEQLSLAIASTTSNLPQSNPE